MPLRPYYAWAGRRARAGYHRLSYELRRPLHLGRVVSCPCCGARVRGFRPYMWEGNIECPRCGSHERHRLLCHFLFEDRPDVLARATSLLHFAPEGCLERRVRAVSGLRYVTADVEPGRAMATCDITELPFEDGAFDVLLCSHVLEHVEDDRAALVELARVLRAGGVALILVPIDRRAPQTYEDERISTSIARAAAYKLPEHRRQYGLDFNRRLEAAGFVVSVDRYVEQLDERLVARHRMRSHGMYVCTK